MVVLSAIDVHNCTRTHPCPYFCVDPRIFTAWRDPWLCLQKKKKAERSKRQKEEEKAIGAGLEPPPRKQQKVRIRSPRLDALTNTSVNPFLARSSRKCWFSSLLIAFPETSWNPFLLTRINRRWWCGGSPYGALHYSMHAGPLMQHMRGSIGK